MSGVLASALGGETAQRFECSRAGCRETASRAIVWRNPKIHEEGRRKVWLACDDHLEVLRGFLEARRFPVDVRMVDELDA